MPTVVKHHGLTSAMEMTLADSSSSDENIDSMQAAAARQREAGADRPNDIAALTEAGKPRDLCWILRASLALDLFVRLTVWGGAFALSVATFSALSIWPQTELTEANLPMAARWAARVASWMLLFNVVYVAELVVLRLVIPKPREGRYTKSVSNPGWQLFLSSMCAALNKARYFAPFPGFLVFQVANLPPMCWLMGPIFGPKSRSCYAMEPHILDPHLVELGRNVVIGFNATVAGHYQQRDAWVIKRTIIEDNVVIGGHAVVYGGVHIHVGAVIGAGAIVLPNTVIGPNEFWAGLPARKVRDLPALV